MTTVYVLNGPNLNLLGLREPEIYGEATLADVEQSCLEVANELGWDLAFRQTNREVSSLIGCRRLSGLSRLVRRSPTVVASSTEPAGAVNVCQLL
jgi:3-dehydroquinate dehydratase